MRNTAFVAVGFAFLVLQSNFFRLLHVFNAILDVFARALISWGADSAARGVRAVESNAMTPNLILPLLVFTGVHEYSIGRGAALALVLGYALDLFATAPVGLYSFLSVITFLLARGAGVRLAAQTVLTQIALALLFALVNGAIALLPLAIFARDPYAARALAPTIIPAAISTAIFAPVVFRIAQRIHQITITVPRPGEGPAR